MPNISELIPFRDLQAALQQGSATLTATVKQCIANLAEQKHLNAFVRTYAEEALTQAECIREKAANHQAGKLAGLVVGIKDLLCYKDHPVQASSKILEGFISQFSGTTVERLINEDAIIIGHQNCDEFGIGSSTEKSIFGPVRNAINPSKVAGGSSGGSAVAVQAHMCHIALGTDTGGSVRQPAAFCGLVGLRPTYGRISRYGMVAHASSFDTIGILAKTIYDCAAVLEIIAGPDAHDSTTSQRLVDRYTTQLDFTKKTRVAYLKEAIDYTGLQPEIRSHTWDTIETLKAQGHHVEGITFPLWEYILPTYYVLTAAEASSNLARFDGVRYGYRDPEVQKVTESYTQTRTQGFGKEVQRRILLGNFVLMSSHYDDDFLQAQKVRRRITEELKAILSSYDFILLPTTPHTAFDLDCNTHDPLSMYWADIYTTLAAIAGVPAISIPIGHDNEGLPIGLQLIGNSFQEASLLGFSNHILQTQK